ncbi:type III polyketide synthase [Geminicoccaceae bacterium 1502E]|nr:type III polyketide synthase [Geminicoccaceae bacterium 1502E]
MRPARLAGLATAVPAHAFSQVEAREAARRIFGGALPDTPRLLAVFERAGIERRHSCLPLEELLRPRGFAERNALGLVAAEELAARAARDALRRAGCGVQEVDALVTVSSTGVATPSLDARLAELLGLPAVVERTPMVGLGCAGGVLGLSRGAALARAAPGSRVLVVVVELCTITLRLGDHSKANLVACALFADGAAAALVSTAGEGPALAGWGEHRWPDSLDVMGWRVEEDGLGVLFAVEVPEIARRGLRAPTDAFLARHGLARRDIDRWICHPGGAKVLDALAEAYGIDEAALVDSRTVLRDFGNMSSATVLFVLQRALAAGAWRRGLAMALGPGFSAGFLLVEP